MTVAMVTLPGGRKMALAEIGEGTPVLYLHDFIDIHGATGDWLDFHRCLATRHRLIAPAHAGCAGSDEDEDAMAIDDAVFHVIEAIESLGLDRVAVVGTGIGGWIAAELAVRARGLVERLVLIGACGLYLPGEPIADLFYEVQPLNGEHTDALRRMLFAVPDSAEALAWVPRGRLSPERDVMRYRMFRFAHRVGFNPPYMHHRLLRRRLRHYGGPALVLWGEEDGLVPPSHGRAYAEGLSGARARSFPGAGHSLHIERGREVADEILAFLHDASTEPRT
jgi:pimeloyl-ACP methyl ester carboxylesterase